ncbi:methyl-accepting chemotaxis protein [Leptospira levettii]|uniref:methyl-accepting chemotaxis protein n=1 Tax=Leptospira levettii TaxID=2023178 RepID=UPI00108294FC|nr:methyl-accepting chemotaxis protein [Leptospira levettii]MCW7507454.1 methyl-accepting chemotaxis protein [Leptospira levettii]MCW7518544.1 methyl-accepting chemotaxis protein [Leptospira levettii]TGK99077.1 methyl-accepting chemotaxis protein [Leptospira levettii]TGM25249.1 methyl-accepting chemotaxis protein [Leptospira levettii]TGM69342.1 methyl-accepting chemotaxis protein [Leptospira levettii]
MKIQNLKTIIIAFSTFIILILTIGISSFSYFIGKEFIVNAYIGEMKNVAKLSSKQIKNFFDEQFILAELISSNPDFSDHCIKQDRNYLDLIMMNISKKYGFYENVFLSSAEENPIVFSDASGKAIGFRWGKTGFDDNIKAALGGKKLLSKVNRSPVTQEPVAVLTVPVFQGNKVIAILGFAISLNHLTDEVINEVKIGSDGFIAITDNEGQVIGHPDKSLILNLNLKELEWGNKLLKLKSNEHMEYFFGKEKIATVMDVEGYNIKLSAIATKSEILSIVHEMLFKICIFAFIILTISVFSFYRLVKNRLQPISNLRDIFKKMTTGNLSQSLEIIYEDEIGELSKDTNYFLNHLKKIISEIQFISQELASSAAQLSSSSDSFSGGAQATAASAEQMSATVEEMSASMENITGSIDIQHHNISQFQIKIQDLANSVKRVGDEINLTLSRMKSISIQATEGERSLTGMNSMIDNILKSSDEMKEIIAIINEISDQTQLLALNAAIEAARAGDAGRGFAVVAEEISKLSIRTASSIKSISEMIGKNAQELNGGAKSIQTSTTLLQDIIRNINGVSEAMDSLYSNMSSQAEINQAVLENSTIVKGESDQIKIAANEQRGAVREISTVITQINEHTINTAAGAEQMSSSAKNLSTTADKLKDICDQFQVTESE